MSEKWVVAIIIGAVALVTGGAFVASRMYERLLKSGAASRLGLDNTPPDADTRARLAHTAATAESIVAILKELDPRAHVTSGYRAPAVNAAVGGVPTSRHQAGLAIDISAGWNIAGTVAAATHLREHEQRIHPGRIRTAIAEDDHLHLEIIDPLGRLDPPGRVAKWLWEQRAVDPGAKTRFATLPA